MADPITLMGIGGMAASAGSSILGAYGAEKSAAAKSQQDLYQASVAELNAKIARQNEEYASQKGEQDAQKYGMAAGQRKGQIIAAQGSSGLDVNSGSAKDVQKSQDLVTNMDLTQIRSNAAKVAYDYENEAINQTNRASMLRVAAQNESEAGDIGAASSILGGASSVSSQWLRGRSMGMWG